eukprot:261263_1
MFQPIGIPVIWNHQDDDSSNFNSSNMPTRIDKCSDSEERSVQVQIQEADEKSRKDWDHHHHHHHTDLSSTRIVRNEIENQNARTGICVSKSKSKPIPFPPSTTKKIEEIKRIQESHSDLVHIYNQSTWQMYWRIKDARSARAKSQSRR